MGPDGLRHPLLQEHPLSQPLGSDEDSCPKVQHHLAEISPETAAHCSEFDRCVFVTAFLSLDYFVEETPNEMDSSSFAAKQRDMARTDRFAIAWR